MGIWVCTEPALHSFWCLRFPGYKSLFIFSFFLLPFFIPVKSWLRLESVNNNLCSESGVTKLLLRFLRAALLCLSAVVSQHSQALWKKVFLSVRFCFMQPVMKCGFFFCVALHFIPFTIFWAHCASVRCDSGCVLYDTGVWECFYKV